MNKYFIWAVSLMGALITLMSGYQFGATKGKRVGQGDPVIETTAVQMHEEYSANELAFGKKYKGKRVVLKGRVGQFHENGFVMRATNDKFSPIGSQGQFQLPTGSPWVDVNCYISDPEMLDLVSRMKKGASVTARGKFHSIEAAGFPTIILTDCAVFVE